MTSERLLSGRFLLMCCFSATVFLSAFQLLPTAPLRILELGGSRAVAAPGAGAGTSRKNT